MNIKMSRLNLVFCLLMLISICDKVCICNSSPTIPMIMKTIQILYQGIVFLKKSTTKEKIPVSNNVVMDQLNSMSTGLSNMQASIENQISTGFTDLTMTTKMGKFYKYVGLVEDRYKNFNEIFERLANSPNGSAAHDFAKFAEESMSTDNKNFRYILNQMNIALYENSFDLTKSPSLLALIAKNKSPLNIMCTRAISSQQLIFDIYQVLAITHLKGLLILLYSVRFTYTKDEQLDPLEKVFQEFKKTAGTTLKEVKNAMSVAQRELWKCDPNEHKQGETFLKLEPLYYGFHYYSSHVFQSTDPSSFFSYFQPTTHFMTPSFHFNSYDCTSLINIRINNHSDSWVNYPQNKNCQGSLQNCNILSTSARICYAHEHSNRNYEWIKTGENVYGHPTRSCGYKDDITGIKSGICLCNCENDSRESDRYFSLFDVVSDVNQNKVVTGVRIVKDDHVFHLQIQQGTLGENGTITKNTVGWKPIEKVDNYLSESVSKYRSENSFYGTNVDWYDNKYVYAVRPDRDTIYLDDLEGDNDQLVTGLRFQQVDHSLRLEVQTTTFNFHTGQLYENSSSWVADFTELERRVELSISDQSDESILAPTQSDVFSVNRQYVRFNRTNMMKDLSQSMIPFIDSQEVTTNPPIPLVGAGIFHKGHMTGHYGGFLALKLIHFDLSAYLSNNFELFRQ